MGTSGSYGGSGSSRWAAARQAFESAVGTTPGAGAAGARDAQPLAAIAAAIAQGLWVDDRRVRLVTPHILSTASLLPHVGGGGGGGGGGGTGSSGGAGRTGGGSSRQLGRGLQRGASVIAAGYALRSGDRAALAELRLDLDELAGLSAWRQCDRILAAVLGDATHPDDAVLRKAAAEQLKAILSADTPPDSLQIVQDFVARYVVDLGLVEIKAQLRVGLPDDEVVAMERELRLMVRERIRSLRPRLAADNGGVSVRALKETTARVAREALAMLRAGGQTA